MQAQSYWYYFKITTFLNIAFLSNVSRVFTKQTYVFEDIAVATNTVFERSLLKYKMCARYKKKSLRYNIPMFSERFIASTTENAEIDLDFIS